MLGISKKLITYLSVATLFSFSIVAAYAPPLQAAYLETRQVRIDSSRPAALTNHNFQFSIDNINPVGSIKFEYCNNSPIEGQVCTIPAGLDLTAATLSSQTGEVGFSIHANSTATTVVLSRIPAVTTIGIKAYGLSNVLNPSSSGTTYVRIATYTSDDATGPPIDVGGVAFSVASSFGADAYVPPYLRFCSGVVVSMDCTFSNGLLANLGDMTAGAPAAATSQLAAFTNGEGYTISVLGNTLTSGNNIIPPLSTPTPSQAGVSQFGINLRANSNPSIGIEKTGPGTGVPQTGYNIPNMFKFAPGDTIATSPLPTESNIFTVTYMVNVSRNQPPGYYNSTLTYLATSFY